MPNRLHPQPGEQMAVFFVPKGGKMSFETISLLLNWVQLGVLLAILFRLHHTFDLIANTQRELRRAIHHLGGARTAEPRIDTAPVGQRSPQNCWIG
jgi:hypothetical protein